MSLYRVFEVTSAQKCPQMSEYAFVWRLLGKIRMKRLYVALLQRAFIKIKS